MLNVDYAVTLDDEREAYEVAMDATDLGFDRVVEDIRDHSRPLNVDAFQAKHSGTGLASVTPARSAA